MPPPRRKNSTPQEEEYIWGSHRGGGGAPLRDQSGQAITNLRNVVKGDESPYKPVPRGEGKRKGTGYDYDYENDAGRRRKPKPTEYEEELWGGGKNDMKLKGKNPRGRDVDSRDLGLAIPRVRDIPPRRGVVNSPQDHSDDYDDHRSNGGRGGGPTGRVLLRKDSRGEYILPRDEEDDEDYDRRAMRPLPTRHVRGRVDEHEDEDYGGGSNRRVNKAIPGLDGYYSDKPSYQKHHNSNSNINNSNSRRKGRDDDDYSYGGGSAARGDTLGLNNNSPLPSPVKRMSALRDMTSGLAPAERDLRLKKEQDYKRQLREQIEEKQRQKDEEKRIAEATKAKELAEYLRSQYQGDIPPHLQDKLNGSMGRDREDRDRDRDRDRGVVGKRDLFKVSRELEDDRRHPHSSTGLGGDKGKGLGLGLGGGLKGLAGRGREEEDGGRFDESEGEEEDEGYRYRDKGPTGGRGKGKGRRSSGEGEDWVSKAEYDRLTSLCDRLMAQQDELQQEIAHQADVLQGIQRGGKGPGKGAGLGLGSKATVGGVANSSSSSLARSKSAFQQRGGAGGGLGGLGRRPTSTDLGHGQQGQGGGLGGRPPLVPRVAFGGNPSSSTLSRAGGQSVNNPKPMNAQAFAKQQQQAGGKKGGGAGFGSGVGRSLSPVGQRRKQPAVPAVGLGGGGGGGGGFSKLANGGGMGKVVKGGPVIVTYNGGDDSPVRGNKGRASNNNRGGGGGIGSLSISGTHRLQTAAELAGESEYLRGNDDHISGDQLDRLLVQARKARAGY